MPRLPLAGSSYIAITSRSNHQRAPRAQFTFLLDDVGIPKDYRHMDGFGVHTFKLINKAGKETFVKFHWKTKQGAVPQFAVSPASPVSWLCKGARDRGPYGLSLQWYSCSSKQQMVCHLQAGLPKPCALPNVVM